MAAVAEEKECKVKDTQRQPAVFVNHGGGPMPLLQLQTGEKLRFGSDEIDQTTILESCQIMGNLIKEHKPSAVLIVSAHWEENEPSVIFEEKPPLLYDYYGFPRESYQLEFNATCDTKLSQQLLTLLKDNGFQGGSPVKNRGWDHGVFIPLLCSGIESKDLPPLMQLSLINTLNAESHVRLGTVLSSLRNKYNVMIIGSGMLFHNMQALRGAGSQQIKDQKSKQFIDWIQTTVSSIKADDNDNNNGELLKSKIESLSNWSNEKKYLNSARFCHPREEHLLPLQVVFGSNWNPQQYQLIMKQDQNEQELKKISDELVNKLNVSVTRAESFGSHIATFVFY